jgi:hypothetical protein
LIEVENLKKNHLFLETCFPNKQNWVYLLNSVLSSGAIGFFWLFEKVHVWSKNVLCPFLKSCVMRRWSGVEGESSFLIIAFTRA